MKSKIITRPTKRQELIIEDFFLDISNEWEKRAKELQARRWQKLRQREMKAMNDG